MGMGQYLYGYGSIPIDTIFNGMDIHLPAILMWTTGVLLVLTHCHINRWPGWSLLTQPHLIGPFFLCIARAHLSAIASPSGSKIHGRSFLFKTTQHGQTTWMIWGPHGYPNRNQHFMYKLLLQRDEQFNEAGNSRGRETLALYAMVMWEFWEQKVY